MKTDRREGGRSGGRRAVSKRLVRVERREPRRGGLGILCCGVLDYTQKGNESRHKWLTPALAATIQVIFSR